MMKSNSRVMIAALLVVNVSLLSAQTKSNAPVLNASLRLRAEAWDWFDVPTRNDSYVFGAAMARLGVSQQLSRLSWRVEAEAPALVGLPENAVAPAPQGALGLGPTYRTANGNDDNVVGLFVRQAYVRVGKLPAEGVSVRAGRFEFIEGTETVPQNATLAALKRDRIAHRLIGNFAFSHVQRTADGVHFAWDHNGNNLTAIGFRPTQGVFDANGWPDLEINVGYIAFNTRLRSDRYPADARAFVILYDDKRGPAIPVSELNIVTYGAHWLQLVPAGSATIDLLAWGALQRGDWADLDQKSNAYALEAGIQPSAATPWKPWLRAGINRSPGNQANAGEHNTFFQLIPTPRVYARFPFFNMMNSRDVFATLMLRPSPKVSLRGDAHQLRLSEVTDGWYSGGGAYQKLGLGYTSRPSNGSRDLATLLDLSVDVRPNPHITVSGYVGFANGGRVIERIYPAGADARLAYLELEWRR